MGTEDLQNLTTQVDKANRCLQGLGLPYAYEVATDQNDKSLRLVKAELGGGKRWFYSGPPETLDAFMQGVVHQLEDRLLTHDPKSDIIDLCLAMCWKKAELEKDDVPAADKAARLMEYVEALSGELDVYMSLKACMRRRLRTA